MFFETDCDTYIVLLAAVGIKTVIFVIFCLIWRLFNLFYNIIAVHCVPNKSLSKKFGPWAAITGCTDGIGKAYAMELAKRDINLVLISRSMEKLQSTAAEIKEKYGVQTKIISADFAEGPKAMDVIKYELEDIPVGILVNNVGKQYTYPTFVGEVPEEELWDVITINVGAVTMMTRLIIGGMKDRGRGAIVNVSSGAECQPLPLMTVYAATKVYIKHFSDALREEYSKHGITVQHLSPFFVNTKMNQFSQRLRKDSFFVPNPQSFAKYAVNTLGKVDHSTGYWTHGIQYFFVNVAPVWMRTKIGKMRNNSYRKEYLRAKQAAATSTKEQQKEETVLL